MKLPLISALIGSCTALWMISCKDTSRPAADPDPSQQRLILPPGNPDSLDPEDTAPFRMKTPSEDQEEPSEPSMDLDTILPKTA